MGTVDLLSTYSVLEIIELSQFTTSFFQPFVSIRYHQECAQITVGRITSLLFICWSTRGPSEIV